MEFVNVVKVTGGFHVLDHNGEPLVGYRNKKHAEQYANGHVHGLFNGAESYNERRDYAKAYLATRAIRVAKPKAQFEMF